MCFQLYSIRNAVKVLEILKQSYKFIIAGIAMYFALLLGDIYIKVPFNSLLFLVPMGVIVYLCLLFLFKDGTVLQIWRLLREKVKRTKSEDV